MEIRRFSPFLCALAFGLSFGANADPGKDESGKGRDAERHYDEPHYKDDRKRESRHDRRSREDHGGHSYFHRHGYTKLDIPKGHYPPPGECRVWYPDRPAGHQPPPGDCRRAPPGAWLIRHPHNAPDHVHVEVYERDRPGVIAVVGVFEIDTGRFLRELDR